MQNRSKQSAKINLTRHVAQAKDGKRGVEVAISAYIDASRTKQYHKRGFLLERSLKFLGDSLGLGRILDMMPNHIDSLCLIPQGPLRLAPLHALPFPTTGSRQYVGRASEALRSKIGSEATIIIASSLRSSLVAQRAVIALVANSFHPQQQVPWRLPD